MKTLRNISLGLIILLTVNFRKSDPNEQDSYTRFYRQQLFTLAEKETEVINCIRNADPQSEEGKEKIRQKIASARVALKACDFWLRYLEPVSYKKINGPLPVEWETEVFEKFEKPYRREGAGLTLAELYLDEKEISKDSLLRLVQSAHSATEVYSADSITVDLKKPDHFFFCNRLFILNLAAIYTTGFECPDTTRIIPELRTMLSAAGELYKQFNAAFPGTVLPAQYLQLYNKTIEFAKKQPEDYSRFDHFTFIRDYVNPLFRMNQQLINEYRVHTRSNVDYSLNKSSNNIFDKSLYNGQNAKGIFLRVNDPAALTEIENIGKLLFYDPILSGNNRRSCASCHDPEQFFTDASSPTAFHFNQSERLPRNTPSLLNAGYNHLLMMDGKHISLQEQCKGVITSAAEMNCREEEVLEKVLSCKEYKEALNKFLKYTPQEKKITLSHIASAITIYYNKFSRYYSPFDKAITGDATIDAAAKEGFNIFMSKAQCATCHFVPQFNGVKPPYVGSEFEVLGVPQDTLYSSLGDDKGRYGVNPAAEMAYAFRTGTMRNAEKTAPYMHNGIFRTLDQVIDFYDAGGGAGKGLQVANQTLSSDSLRLSKDEKKKLVKFIGSLNEEIVFEKAPEKLPESKRKELNKRKVGGEY